MNNKRKILMWLITFLVIAFVRVTSADNETHLADGSWIFQSDSEQEYILTFYPDGTFHLVITESDDFFSEENYEGDEDYEDNENYEDYEDEEDSEDWEEFLADFDVNDNGVLDVEDFEAALERVDEDLPPSWDDALQEFGDANGDGVIDQREAEDVEGSGDWEEFLIDVDVNDNGVLDEEDFEAAQERGDEGLPLSWDDVLQEFGDANGDGVIDQGEFEHFEEYGPGGHREVRLSKLMTDVFGETMVMTTSLKGTWKASDVHVTLTRVEEVYEFNNLTLEEYYAILLDIEFDLMVLESEKNGAGINITNSFGLIDSLFCSDNFAENDGGCLNIKSSESTRN